MMYEGGIKLPAGQAMLVVFILSLAIILLIYILSECRFIILVILAVVISLVMMLLLPYHEERNFSTDDYVNYMWAVLGFYSVVYVVWYFWKADKEVHLHLFGRKVGV